MEIVFERQKTGILRKVNSGRYNHDTRRSLDLDDVEDAPASTLWAKNEFLFKDDFPSAGERQKVKVVDLFCGSGGLSLGVKRALLALNLAPEFLLACDAARESLDIYRANFKPRMEIRENIVNLISGPVGRPDIQHEMADFILDSRLTALEDNVDIFIAGPPCEGHSNLNNKTRRSDIRNELYVYASIIAAKLGAKIIIIENVPTVRRANQGVVTRAHEILTSAGYTVFTENMVFASNNLLVGQLRRRHFLVAIKGTALSSQFPLVGMKFPDLTVWDVIGDITNATSPDNLMLQASNLSDENKSRIDYLFDNDEYDLPDFERPDCHRLKTHNYKSVYGRMYADQPSYTITTGFQSPGRGRYIHPTERRGLTPKEGARIQGFPDWFRWFGIGISSSRQNITRLIGDAVPPNLGMFVALAAIDLMPNGF